ncbi:hypothetical protein WAF17_19140 [Bernardetia sp. ABR2-2B]|uniref:hypothetical protein n=1 Tax=Bernardetia sp. ABR2-2B TaxID=3127472 RepID=UPI0030D009F5
MKNLILLLFIFSFLGCANTKNNNSKKNATTKESTTDTSTKQDNPMKYKELAQQKFQTTGKAKQKLEYIENENKTFVLCKSTTLGTVMQPRDFIQYAVYNMKTNELVYEGSVDGGSVSWYDNQRLEIYQQEGIPIQGMTREDMIQIYDIVEKTQKRKSEVEKK